jgi:hypothetical protein
MGSLSAGRITPASAKALRERLLENPWPTSRTVGILLGFGGDNPAQRAYDLRRTGRLFGVWSARLRTYVHPDFQFDSDGRLRPHLERLLNALPASGDRGGWRRAFWLYGSRESLGGRAPAELFAENPESVFELARKDFPDQGPR